LVTVGFLATATASTSASGAGKAIVVAKRVARIRRKNFIVAVRWKRGCECMVLGMRE
jgi:hypothetical protein